MITTVLDASPLFWPGAILSAVLAVVGSGPVGRLLRAHRVVGFLVVLALGGIVTLTLLPDTKLSLADNARYGAQECVLDGAGPHPLSELLTATQSSLNVALFVPLGLAVGLAGTWGRRAAAAAVALCVPLAVESVQYALPVLGRACDAQDVWDNLFGLFLGLLLAVVCGPVARAAVRARRRRGNGPVRRPVRAGAQAADAGEGAQDRTGVTG
ncbi:VanZ family protein [Kitasatospora sp. NPDC059571]|uniref:VanZ family protein n=1 Tax=Kitasatospora sp. NPDC059571 TaxID=3346871 RepID=UPI003673DF18